MIEQFRKWKSLTNNRAEIYKKIDELQNYAAKLGDSIREIEQGIIQTYIPVNSSHATYVQVDGTIYKVIQMGVYELELKVLNEMKNSEGDK